MKPPSTGALARVVPEGHRLDRAGRLHGERRGLDDLLEQAVDLGRERGRGGVALLGEVRVAGAAAGERGEERLVVPEPKADRRRRDAAGTRVGRDGAEL